jgi:hypothetical protein
MKFRKAEPVEFFVSTAGYLVFQNYSITIILTPDQSKVLLKQLPDIITKQEQHWTGIEEE